jgi:hypothetical protein
MGERSDAVIYPDFLFIGTAKAGSSWIYEILNEHPEVFVPPAKDIQFFDYQYDRGFEWYLSFFESGKGKKAIGELSHDYFLDEQNAIRIHEDLPGVRLICSLREPISQIVSNFLQHRTAILNRDTDLSTFAFEADVLKACDYYFNLRPFYERFPSERILVLFFDDLIDDPSLFARRIFRFLEVDPSFAPGILHKKELSAREPRLYWLAHVAYRAGLLLRRLGLPNVVGAIKRSKSFERVLYRPIDRKPEMPEELKIELNSYFEERYKDLPELIGQPLPEGWL